MQCLSASWPRHLVPPLTLALVGCTQVQMPSLFGGAEPKEAAPRESTGRIPAKAQATTGDASVEVRPKEITRVAPMASVVLEKNCPDIVQPYRLSDNLASVAVFGMKSWLDYFGTAIERGLGTKSAAAAQGKDILASAKLAAKQLNWLPMSAEKLYGERAHRTETNVLPRESKLGKKYYPVADRMLQEILTRIDQPHEYEFQLFILKSSGRNAAARPGGYLYVDQGLIDDPAQHPKAYFALAHEVAHVLQRHETKELQSMVIDSIKLKDDLVTTLSRVKGEPGVILNHVKVGKNLFTRHHIDQELQSDSCAAKLLSRALADRRQLTDAVNAFLRDLGKPEPTRPAPAPQSDAERLARTVHDVVDTPIRRHPNSQEREHNLRAILDEIARAKAAQAR
jgi:hypothetical protein